MFNDKNGDNKSVMLVMIMIMILYSLAVCFFISNVVLIIPLLVTFAICLNDFFKSFSHNNIYHVDYVVWFFFIYFFCIAPVLHLSNNYYYDNFSIKDVIWEDAFSVLLWFVMGGVLVYSFTSKLSLFKRETKIKVISIDNVPIKLCVSISMFFLVVSFAAQWYVYKSFGGVLGYIMARQEEGVDAFNGLGLLVMISESFPIIFGINLIIILRNKNIKNIFVILGVVLLFLLMKIVFGGLAGSRSNIIWSLFWMVGLIHIYVRRFSWKYVFLGLSFLSIFMTVYGVYKKNNSEFISVFLTDGVNSNNYNNKDASPFLSVLLTDFSRSDIQAYEIYAYEQGVFKNLRYGQTYINSLIKLAPPLKDIIDVDSKTEAGTNMIYNSSGSSSTRLFGLIGEFCLNFPYYFFPIVFVFFSFIVQYVKSYLLIYECTDVRLMIYPFLVTFCLIVIIGDSDNVVYFLIKNGFIPVILIRIITIITPVRECTQCQ